MYANLKNKDIQLFELIGAGDFPVLLTLNPGTNSVATYSNTPRNDYPWFVVAPIRSTSIRHFIH